MSKKWELIFLVFQVTSLGYLVLINLFGIIMGLWNGISLILTLIGAIFTVASYYSYKTCAESWEKGKE